METLALAFRRVDPDRPFSPLRRGTPHSAGLDLIAAINQPIFLPRMAMVKVPTNLIIEPPKGSNLSGFILSRSGMTYNKQLVVANAPGLIDPDYRGEIFVIIQNLNPVAEQIIEPGDFIAQIVYMPTPHYPLHMQDQPSEPTERGAGGFGSTDAP